MKKNKKISLQPMLVFPFLGLILLSVSLVGIVSMHNGKKAVNQAVHRLKIEMNTRITDHLTRFLELPHQINQVNAAALGSGLMDAGDQAALARHFREQIEIFDAVTSINFSNRDGGLVNAGREGHRGDLYKIVTDDFKSGPFRKYALDSRGRRAELISTLHHFDGRTRPWYVEAVEKSQPVWSEPYVLFTGQDLSINAARPVFDDQNHLLGVVAVDLFLSHLSEFLAHLNTGASGRNIILERSGLMIAASTGENPFTRSPETADYRRKGLDDSTDLPTRAAAAALQDTFGGYRQIRDPASFEFDLEDETQLGSVIPYKGPYGLDWLIVTVIPEQAFMAHVPDTHRATLGLMLITLLAAAGISYLVSRKITRPVSELNTAANALSRGKWDQQIRRPAKIREISDLTDAFNRMASQLEQMFTGLNREIDERKAAEAQIRQLEKAESLDRMAGAVAHHYNNQLSAVMGNLELALIQKDGADQADLTRALENAMKAARRAAHMGDEMLSLLGNKTVRRSRLDLVETCRGFLMDVRTRMPDNISVQIQLPETGLEVMANVEQMQDLLDNLMQNAWEAMGEKTGRIVVDAGTADSADIPPEPRWPLTFSPDAARYVRVSVKDQGDGIAPARMEKIFDPFFSTRFIGRGLGLSLSLSIVKYHNGCIAVESVPGKGSTFHVFLPQAV